MSLGNSQSQMQVPLLLLRDVIASSKSKAPAGPPGGMGGMGGGYGNDGGMD
jgi:archaeal chaperonin